MQSTVVNIVVLVSRFFVRRYDFKITCLRNQISDRAGLKIFLMAWNIHKVTDQIRAIQHLKEGDTGLIYLTFYDY